MHVSISLPTFLPSSLAFICLLVSNDPDLINNNKTSREQAQHCNNKFTNDGQQFPLGKRRKSTWQFPAEWQAVSLSFLLPPFLPPSRLISFYSGRGTWQSCIEWTLNRLQLYKDRLFVFPSVFPSIFPSVCLKLHARGIRYNHRFVPKIVQVASMSSVATLNSNCNCSSCRIRLFNCYTKCRWHCKCKIIQ